MCVCAYVIVCVHVCTLPEYYGYTICVHVCYLCIGRSAMKQYLPKKPVRRGFKLWVVADSSNGYFLDVDVYVGRAWPGRTGGFAAYRAVQPQKLQGVL